MLVGGRARPHDAVAAAEFNQIWRDAEPLKYRYEVTSTLRWLLPNGKSLDRGTATATGAFLIGGSLAITPTEIRMLPGDVTLCRVDLDFRGGRYGEVTEDPETRFSMPPDGVARLVTDGESRCAVEGLAGGTSLLAVSHGPAAGSAPIVVDGR